MTYSPDLDMMRSWVQDALPNGKWKDASKIEWLCAIRDEKTPSCYINIEKRTYCDFGGDSGKLSELCEQQGIPDPYRKEDDFHTRQAYTPTATVDVDAIRINDRWKKATPASIDFPYLKNKRVPSLGLKEDTDPKMGRVLLVPARSPEGVIKGLERITPEGQKMHLGAKSSVYHLIGNLAEGEKVLVSEGLATGLSLHEISGYPVAVSFGSQQLLAVAQLLRDKKNCISVVCPDADTAGARATEEALKAGVQVITMPEGSPKGEDWNDLTIKHGADEAQRIFRQQEQNSPTCAEAEEGEYLSSIDELELEEADFLISGILERDSLVGVFGESGAGKTFFVLDALSSVATGIDFHGRPVQQAPCIYVCAEGKRGIVKRNRAWNLGRWKNPDGIKAFYPVRCNITLPDDEAEQKLISLIDGTIQKHKITNPGIIAFDTVARTLVGDENSNADMSAYIRAMDRIKARYPGVAVVLVHHTGHTEKNRARGASSLKCALDAEIQVAISADTATGKKTMTVSNTKMKDAEEFPDIYFEMKAVEVFHDKDGEPQSSLYLEEIEGATDSRSRDKKTKLSPVEQVGIDSYLEALEDSIKAKIESGDIISTSEGVHIEQWRPFYYKRSPADKTKTKIEYFNRARNSLITKQRLTVENDYYRLAGEEHNRTASGYFLTLNKESKSTSPHHTTVSPHVDLDIPQVHTTPHTPLGVWSVDMSPTPKTVVDLSPRGTETPPAEYNEAQAQQWLETAPEEVQEAYRQRVKLYSTSPSMAKSGQALRKTWEQFRKEVA